MINLKPQIYLIGNVVDKGVVILHDTIKHGKYSLNHLNYRSFYRLVVNFKTIEDINTDIIV